MNQDLHTKDRRVKVTDRDILHAEKDGFSQNCDTFGACGVTVHVQVAFVLYTIVGQARLVLKLASFFVI